MGIPAVSGEAFYFRKVLSWLFGEGRQSRSRSWLVITVRNLLATLNYCYLSLENLDRVVILQVGFSGLPSPQKVQKLMSHAVRHCFGYITLSPYLDLESRY